MADEASTNQKLVAGVVVAALGVAVILWFLNDDPEPDPDGGGGGDSGIATMGCTLTVAGIDAIATALKSGSTANQIVRILAPTASTAVCVAAVKKLAAGQSASVKVETPEGVTGPQVLNPYQLTQPPPPPPSSPTLTPIVCFQWTNAVLFDLCRDGVIGGPT